MTFQYPEGITDFDFYDLQTYLEGGREESLAAARRMDVRAVENGRLALGDYQQRWGDGS